MGLSSYCGNCGQAKDQATFADNYCSACTTAIREAREHAIKENLDPGQATRSALARRAHDIHRNRPDPFNPPTRADYWASGNRRGDEGIILLFLAVAFLVVMPVVYLVAAALF